MDEPFTHNEQAKQWAFKIEDYTEQQWAEEIEASGVAIKIPGFPLFEYGTTLPCPKCKTVGFYGARIAGSEGYNPRKYRACKFCGLWQEASGEARNRLGTKAYRCIAIYCPNGHIYDWRMPEIKDFGNCPVCQTKLEITDWASDNPNHPFRYIQK